jgi:hypothetical protein
MHVEITYGHKTPLILQCNLPHAPTPFHFNTQPTPPLHPVTPTTPTPRPHHHLQISYATTNLPQTNNLIQSCSPCFKRNSLLLQISYKIATSADSEVTVYHNPGQTRYEQTIGNLKPGATYTFLINARTDSVNSINGDSAQTTQTAST